ncbi:VOC family protein [Halorubrum sp. CBA1125]|uniref:VOC family protein n=1 Tax=Halorubrum sp. CBA1125 TaxID=2668072 RepID=UPI0012E7E1FE|nr:VOC family protein [Halorubrum sp. CBA1125]MUW15534.1 VOC family protein [Halorubrum sp. CBA1125]
MADDTIPQVDVPLPEISHVAFVVEDLEESMRRFGALLGMEPWFTYRYEPPRLTDTTYRGEPAEYSMRVAITDVEGPVDLTTKVVSGQTLQRVVSWLTALRDRLGLRSGSDDDGALSSLPNPGLPGLNVELIEPLDGPSTYTEHLDAGGTGIHHIGCFAFDDPRAAVERYEDAGIQIVQSGRFGELEFWYLDMREELDGVLLEVAANLWTVPSPDGVFPG